MSHRITHWRCLLFDRCDGGAVEGRVGDVGFQEGEVLDIDELEAVSKRASRLLYPQLHVPVRSCPWTR
jgi:hypothetical protein